MQGSAASMPTAWSRRAWRTCRAQMRPVLEQRARDMLTQAHLSRHVVFHVFHTPAIPRHAPAIFGMSPSRFRALATRA